MADDKPKRFWETAQSVVAGIATLKTAVATLVAALHNAGMLDDGKLLDSPFFSQFYILGE